MMTFSKISAAAKYYLDLAREDYYLKGGEPDGQWCGAVAKLLKLKGSVEAEHLKNLLKGYDLTGKVALCQNAESGRVQGVDLTFNAPKSVSVLWAAVDTKLQQQIQQAQLRAVREAIALLEEHAAFTRRAKAGVIRESVVGFVVALFEHSTSRAKDPHLHTHAVVPNLAPRSDGTWGTIELRSIMLWQKAAGMVYQLSLAQSMRELGFFIVPDGDSFKLETVPESICVHFSKRSQQIVQSLKANGIRHRASKAGDFASLSSRKAKGEINRQQLFSEWKRELSELGFTDNVIQSMRTNTVCNDLSRDMLDAESLTSELTESRSVFTSQDIFFKGGIRALENQQSLKSIKALYKQITDDRDISISLGLDSRHSNIFTTKAVLKAEQSLINDARFLSSKTWCQKPADLVERCINAQAFKLSDEQAFAVHNVCNPSQLSILQGSAGAGKSASMRCVRDIYQAKGKRVVGASIAKSAAKNLEKEAGIQTYTIARLLVWLESDKPPVKEGDVLIVDEAGQVGTFHLEKLLSYARAQNFKIILVGEDKQLDAIEHGGVLRYLSSPEVVGTTRVETIRRQTQDWDRQAVADFRDGYANQALVQYQNRGQLHLCEDADSTVSKIIEAWTEYRKTHPSRQSMVIAQSWSDVLTLNNTMRAKLQLDGLVGNENIKLRGVVSERELEMEISLGERVRFTKNDYKLGFTNGDVGTVTKVKTMDDGAIWIRVRLDTGTETQFMASKYCDDDGRVYLIQAYAQTVYSSQGLTVDGNVFVYYTQGMDRAHTYVACSRHKDAAHIFANAQEFESEIPVNFENAPKDIGLREALAKNMSRDLRPKLASEYLSHNQINKVLNTKERQLDYELTI